jgi:hypothetical protein
VLSLSISLSIGQFAVSDRRSFPRGRLPASLDFTKNGSGHPHEPNDTSNDAIGDLAFAGVVREPQAKAAVDNAKGDHNAAEPEMRIGGSLPTLILLEEAMVDESGDWLEEEKDEDYYADDWMVVR